MRTARKLAQVEADVSRTLADQVWRLDPGPLDSLASGKTFTGKTELTPESKAMLEAARKRYLAAGDRTKRWNPNPSGSTGVRG